MTITVQRVGVFQSLLGVLKIYHFMSL